MAKDMNVVWQNIDVETLSVEMQEAYETYKEAQRYAAQLRVRFEEMVNDAAGLPEGKKLAFGYRFGKLSAAMVEDDRKAKATAPSKLSLSDFMAMTKEQGRRT